MYPRPRLIAELVTLTRPWGWTLPDLARELHTSLATLGAYRCGRRQLSMESYSRIIERFGDYRIIRDAAYEYARTYHVPVTAPALIPADGLPVPTVRALARYIEHFADEALRGRGGLLLVAPAPQLLTSAVAYVRACFAATDVTVPVIRASQSLAASELRDALAAPLVVIERIEFVHTAIADLLRRRDEILRPTIATSLTSHVTLPAEDLLRIVRTRMRPLVIPHTPQLSSPTPPARPSRPRVHAAA